MFEKFSLEILGFILGSVTAAVVVTAVVVVRSHVEAQAAPEPAPPAVAVYGVTQG
jgi:hypothetical protein